MSLDFDLTKVKDWEKFARYPDPEADNEYLLTETTKQIIFAAMYVGVGRITEKNYINFYVRLAAYEAVHGALRSMNGKKIPFTLEEVKMYIGLCTNATYKHSTEFLKELYAYVTSEEQDATQNQQTATGG